MAAVQSALRLEATHTLALLRKAQILEAQDDDEAAIDILVEIVRRKGNSDEIELHIDMLKRMDQEAWQNAMDHYCNVEASKEAGQVNEPKIAAGAAGTEEKARKEQVSCHIP